jgi:hypothetical protein
VDSNDAGELKQQTSKPVLTHKALKDPESEEEQQQQILQHPKIEYEEQRVCLLFDAKVRLLIGKKLN